MTDIILLYHKSRFLWLDDGIEIASRYFAIVRLATLIPFSFNKSAILLSLSGFTGLSLLMSSFIKALIAVAEHSPPAAVET